MTINEFLAARFAEEQAQADAWASTHPGSREILDRVRSDLNAKREVVATLVEYQQRQSDARDKADKKAARDHVPGLRVACAVLAQPYSWHDDFDEGWFI